MISADFLNIIHGFFDRKKTRKMGEKLCLKWVMAEK